MSRAAGLPHVDLGPTAAVRAERSEMLGIAATVDDVAHRLRRRAGAVAAALAEVGLTAALSPATAAACETALGMAVAGPGGLVTVAHGLDVTAEGVRAVVRLMAGADEAIRFGAPIESALGVGLGAVLSGTPAGRLLLGGTRVYAGTEGLPAVAPAPALGGTAPVSLPGLIDRLARVNDLPDGSIEVLTLTAPDGTRRHVVTLPGTDGLSRGLARSLPADVAIRDGQVSTYERGVLAAMRASGVRPGEPVVLVGHSMGGMVAAEIARHHPGLRISQVVTAGSPIGDRPPPAGVRLLALEHDTDPVPRLDGARLSDVPGRRVTVTFSDSGVGPANPHDLTHYRRGAALAAGSADPLVRTAVDEVDDLLDEPAGATATSRVWRISRISRAGG